VSTGTLLNSRYEMILKSTLLNVMLLFQYIVLQILDFQ